MTDSNAGDVLEIRMQSRPGEGDDCRFCRDGICSGSHALPVFNGDVMSNDWPGEWGGVACCEECYEKHLRGEMKTFDHLYRHLLVERGWIDGAGI